VLEISGVEIGRGEAVSARIGPGEIVAICGPTGVGKTTLLRALLGLDATIGGEVRYDGALLEGGPGLASRPFAWVPQDAPLLAGTLDANVRLAGGAGDTAEALASIGAERLVEAIGDGRLGAGGRAVSGGERQWINLARAVATRQPVLLLDEPTSGLDAAAQARVLAAIVKLRGARTVVLVTHRPEPLEIADRVIRVPG
jgi:ABC-type transport system involved in cytochrome bd biosynthesis fused ATPase/permease subunit